MVSISQISLYEESGGNGWAGQAKNLKFGI